MTAISAAQAGGENVVRFLSLVARSEGTSTQHLTKNDGYDVVVTGITGPEVFTDYSNHPFAHGRAPQIVRLVPRLESTAAGRYQILVRYWLDYMRQMNLPDFSPVSQDLVAIQQIRERGAIEPILAGDIEKAVELCSNIWASFPGNAYGQGGRSLDTLLSYWNDLVTT